MPQTFHEQSLTDAIKSYLTSKIPSFNLVEHADVSFSGLGLDSAAHVELTRVIEDRLGSAVPPELAFDYPTVNSLMGYLKQEAAMASDSQEG